MAKSSTERGFRKVDVDQYDEDNFKDELNDILDSGPDEAEVTRLLMNCDNKAALQTALLNPPVNTKNCHIQISASELVLRVLSSIKTAEIQKIIDSLDADSIDVLAKYIYKCFSLGLDGQNCACLLTWHEKLVEKGGVGCIVRVLTDRKRL